MNEPLSTRDKIYDWITVILVLALGAFCIAFAFGG